MYLKLYILVVLAGCLSAETTTESTTAEATTVAASTTAAATGTNNETVATPTTQANTTTVRPTKPPKPHQRPPHHGLIPPHRPHGPPKTPPHRPIEIPGLPIISGIIEAFRKNAESFIPGPHGGPGDRQRHPRSILASSISLNVSNASTSANNSELQIPNAEDMVPEIPASSDFSNVSIPKIPDMPNFPLLLPGLQDAIDQARKSAANDINPKKDLVSGIQEAIVNGLRSGNPTEAMRKLVSTVLKAYLAVARKCPYLIVGGYVLHEGLSVAAIILRILADVSGQVQDAL